MKTLFIEARSEVDILPVVKKALKFLKEDVALVSTIQHLDKLEQAKEFLEKNSSKEVKAHIAGQVLGCKAPEIPKDIKQILYIGSGRFHPICLHNKTGREVIIADPLCGSVAKFKEESIDKIKKRRKGALVKFLSSENIGILISTKHGQKNVQGGSLKINSMKKRFDDKKFYSFAFDTLAKEELENFPFIEFWVNTACPRIFEDFQKGIINIEDIL